MQWRKMKETGDEWRRIGVQRWRMLGSGKVALGFFWKKMNEQRCLWGGNFEGLLFWNNRPYCYVIAMICNLENKEDFSCKEESRMVRVRTRDLTFNLTNGASVGLGWAFIYKSFVLEKTHKVNLKEIPCGRDYPCPPLAPPLLWSKGNIVGKGCISEFGGTISTDGFSSKSLEISIGGSWLGVNCGESGTLIDGR